MHIRIPAALQLVPAGADGAWLAALVLSVASELLGIYQLNTQSTYFSVIIQVGLEFSLIENLPAGGFDFFLVFSSHLRGTLHISGAHGCRRYLSRTSKSADRYRTISFIFPFLHRLTLTIRASPSVPPPLQLNPRYRSSLPHMWYLL